MAAKHINQIVMIWSGLVAVGGFSVAVAQSEHGTLRIMLIWALTALAALAPLEVLYAVVRAGERR